RADDVGNVIVRYEPGTTAADRLDTRQDADVRGEKVLVLPRAELLQTQPGVSATQAIRALNSDPDVAYAEANVRRRMLLTPNDARFADLWGLNNTGQTPPSDPADPPGPLT